MPEPGALTITLHCGSLSASSVPHGPPHFTPVRPVPRTPGGFRLCLPRGLPCTQLNSLLYPGLPPPGQRPSRQTPDLLAENYLYWAACATQLSTVRGVTMLWASPPRRGCPVSCRPAWL